MKILSEGDTLLASVLLDSHKVSYTTEDLKDMKAIRDYYNSIPENCKYDTISSGIFRASMDLQEWS